MLAGSVKTMQATEMENYKKYINILLGKTEGWEKKKQHFKESLIDCTGLIKSNRPLFRLHFSVTYILEKYSIFGKILDKMLSFSIYTKIDNLLRFVSV